MTSTSAPASSTALRGSKYSTCSTPSFAMRKAIRLPVNSFAIGITPFQISFERTGTRRFRSTKPFLGRVAWRKNRIRGHACTTGCVFLGATGPARRNACPLELNRLDLEELLEPELPKLTPVPGLLHPAER